MKPLFFALTFFLSASAYSAINAVTDTGDVVILSDDGTWKYAEDKPKNKNEIKTNSKKFSTPKDSTFSLKSKKTHSEFNLDPSKWSFEKSNSNDAAEYALKLKTGDLYALAITEEIQIDLENLAEIALINARSAAPDAKIVSQEYRIVNGNKLIHLKIEGTIQGIKFIYYGYYSSNESGSVQYLAYTAKSLAAKYEKDIYDLLNGFVHH